MNRVMLCSQLLRTFSQKSVSTKCALDETGNQQAVHFERRPAKSKIAQLQQIWGKLNSFLVSIGPFEGRDRILVCQPWLQLFLVGPILSCWLLGREPSIP